MDRLTRRILAELLAPGLAAGWAAGIAVLVLALLHSAIAGWGLLWPLEAAVDGFYSQGVDPGPLAALWGLVLHFVVSGVLGVLFNAATPRGASYAWASGFGLLFAAVVFLLMKWLVVPIWSPLLDQRVSAPVFLAYHLVYGLIVPLALPMRRTVARGRAEERAHVS